MFAFYILSVVAPTSEAVSAVRRASARVVANYIRSLPTPEIAHCDIRIHRRFFTSERDRAQAIACIRDADCMMRPGCAVIVVPENALLQAYEQQTEDSVRREIDVSDSDSDSDSDSAGEAMALRPRRKRSHKYGAIMVTE